MKIKIKYCISLILCIILVCGSSNITYAGTSKPTQYKSLAFGNSYGSSESSAKWSDVYSNYLFYGAYSYQLKVTNNSSNTLYVYVKFSQSSTGTSYSVPGNTTTTFNFDYINTTEFYLSFYGSESFYYTIKGVTL